MCPGTCFSHGQVAKVSLNHELEEQWCPLSSKKQRTVKGSVQTAAQLTIERSEKGKLKFPTPQICLDVNCTLPAWWELQLARSTIYFITILSLEYVHDESFPMRAGMWITGLESPAEMKQQWFDCETDVVQSGSSRQRCVWQRWCHVKVWIQLLGMRWQWQTVFINLIFHLLSWLSLASTFARLWFALMLFCLCDVITERGSRSRRPFC